jgi:16S rRNA (cytidine1402-2'-O)-methyltransferase
MPGVLYVVATPIGNLEDMTLRALRVLKEADLIAAEDTRHTRRLLNHYGIRTPLTSYHEHNETEKARSLVKRLCAGNTVALVSDAGTPAISDPGYDLVRVAVEAGVPVVPVPGPSALTAVLSAGGLPTDRFVFEGFLPARKGERRERLTSLREEGRTLVFYEAPHRLKEALADLAEIFGPRDIVLARELTKVHEEFMRGPIDEVISRLAHQEPRGEVVVVVRGFSGRSAPSAEQLRAEARTLQRNGLRTKEIAEVLGEKYGYSKKEIYRLVLEA